MSLSFEKGQSLNLSKDCPTLSKIMIGLGWNPNATASPYPHDLDASAYLLNSDGKLATEANVIFYNQKESPNKAVTLSGDNRTGGASGDDEEIFINLPLVPADVAKIVIVVSIHNAAENSQNFGQVDNSYARMVDNVTNVEILRFDLTEDHSTSTLVTFAELYRHNGDWKFKAVGAGSKTDLAGFIRSIQ
jgi:tellurium resistance protein TerD